MTPARRGGGPSGAGGARRRRAARLSALRRSPSHLFERQKSSGRLGPFLAWSVVFADIGTSIYYVPGLLFRELGGHSPSAAAAFVLLTGFAFVLLALKYVDVAARYPDGGGVVSVASDAFGPMIGCIGGILICVDYFLTGAISSVSGFQYLAAELPRLTPYIAPAACGALVVLGLLNYIGIRESAVLTAVLAIGSLTVNLVVMGVVVGAHRRRAVAPGAGSSSRRSRRCRPGAILVGFGSSWLAFSGLESISQIAPALQEPRERTALRAMLMVIARDLGDVADHDRVRDRAARRRARQPGPVPVRAGRGVRHARADDRDRADVVDAADRRRQHRAHRLLPRVPGAGAARLHAALAGRAQPALRHAPPGDHHRGRRSGGGGAGHARADGAAGRHVLVRPAGRVHADVGRARPHARAGEQARAGVLAGPRSRRCWCWSPGA